MSNAPPRVVAVLVLACALSGRASAQAPTQAPAQTPAPRPAAAASAAGSAVRDLPLTAAERQAYVGTYSAALPQGGTGLVRVYLQGDTLRMRPQDEDRAPRLLYQGGHVFVAEGVPDFVITFVLERGRAARFSVQKEDGVIQATRVP